METKDFFYGSYKYQYQLIRQNRKTLSLTVNPDMSLVVKSPRSASGQKIDDFLKRKWLWMEKQLRFFKKYQRKKYKKEYISGESFLYLGRQYRLKVVTGVDNTVSLKRGYFMLETSLPVLSSHHNQKIMNYWYRVRTKKVFKKRFELVLKKFNFDFTPVMKIKEMPKRWGSFVSKKKIYLNPELIKASIDCIDYVITHELCHMKYKNHSIKFFEYLELMYPGWEKVKEKLELRFG